MRIHEIKCRNEYFEEVINGNKGFTVRINDRDYTVGDLLAVNEIAIDHDTPKPGNIYTGRCCLVKITYILDDPAYCKDGFITMGFQPCAIYMYEGNALMRDCCKPVYSVPAYTEV